MIDKGSRRWQYSTDTLYMGGKRIKEIYVGNKKVYPVGVNMMRLRNIIEDDAAFYGDAGGKKYNWYIWFSDNDGEDNGEIYDTFGTQDRVLVVYIFCDYHAPHDTSKYYGKDKLKPIGFVNWGDEGVVKRDSHGNPIETIPRMRIIYYEAWTAEKNYHDGVPVNPNWRQGRNDERYYHPGEGLIWFGWQWWLYRDSDHIYKYDFIKREFGPELTGADLWVPVDPDITPQN